MLDRCCNIYTTVPRTRVRNYNEIQGITDGEVLTWAEVKGSEKEISGYPLQVVVGERLEQKASLPGF
jgi:hypothetical protein